jgi:dephospho-CoA kinase
MIIGLVGLNGCGKDTVANYLVEKYGFIHKSCSDVIRQEVINDGNDPKNRENLIQKGNYLRKNFGANYLAKKLIDENKGNLVISSVRNIFEVKEIKNNGGKIVFIDANLEKRFERTKKRVLINNSHGEIDFLKFKELEEKELTNPDKDKQQLNEFISLKDYYLDNSFDLKTLFSSIDILINKIKGDINE